MNSKEELKDLINRIKTATNLTQGKISSGAGYEEQSLAQLLAKPKGHEAAIKQLKLIYGDVLKNSIKPDEEELLDEPAEKNMVEEDELLFAPELGRAAVIGAKKHLDEIPDASDYEKRLSLEAITNLTRSNMLLAEAQKTFAEGQKIFAESNKKMADNNEQLLQRIPVTVSAPAQIGGVALPNTADFLEVLAEVASGEMHFENKHEAAAALHRRFFAPPKKVL